MVHKYKYADEASLNHLPLVFAGALRIEAGFPPLVRGRKSVLATHDPGLLVRRHAVEGLIQSLDATPW